MPQPQEALPAPAPAEQPAQTESDPFDPLVLNKRFHENRNKFPPEQLAAYAGKLVAWWPDGSRIFDADASFQALFQRLREAGYPDSFFMFEAIPRPEQAEIDPYNALCMRFTENRNNFPAEQLAAYVGSEVAWWRDGSRIVDADVDGVALRQRLREATYDLSYFVFEYIPFPDETCV